MLQDTVLNAVIDALDGTSLLAPALGKKALLLPGHGESRRGEVPEVEIGSRKRADVAAIPEDDVGAPQFNLVGDLAVPRVFGQETVHLGVLSRMECCYLSFVLSSPVSFIKGRRPMHRRRIRSSLKPGESSSSSPASSPLVFGRFGKCRLERSGSNVLVPNIFPTQLRLFHTDWIGLESALLITISIVSKSIRISQSMLFRGFLWHSWIKINQSVLFRGFLWDRFSTGISVDLLRDYLRHY